MRRKGAATAWSALLAACLLFGAAAPVSADLLGGLTETVDEPVDATTDLVDDGAESTVLDEPVDSLTDTVDETVGELTGVVDDTVDDTVTTTSTTTTTTTTTTVPSSTTTTVPDDETDEGAVETSGEPPTGSEEVIVAPQPPPSDGDGGPASTSSVDTVLRTESLEVLSAPLGLTEIETAGLGPASESRDPSIYGRLLEWLTGTGPGALRLLAGPLLGLEILVRALLSAGSGLVAPLSLLTAYVVQGVWSMRTRQTPVTRPASVTAA